MTLALNSGAGTIGISDELLTALGSLKVNEKFEAVGDDNVTLAVGASYDAHKIACGNITESGTGRHALITGLHIAPPAITNDAAASVTAASTLYISGPTSATGANNYSLLVKEGNTKLGGDLTVTGGLTLTNALPINQGGTGATDADVARGLNNLNAQRLDPNLSAISSVSQYGNSTTYAAYTLQDANHSSGVLQNLTGLTLAVASGAPSLPDGTYNDLNISLATDVSGQNADISSIVISSSQITEVTFSSGGTGYATGNTITITITRSSIGAAGVDKIIKYTSATTAIFLDFRNDAANAFSNSATAIPSQQSVKAYVDNKKPATAVLADKSEKIKTTVDVTNVTRYIPYVAAVNAVDDASLLIGNKLAFNPNSGSMTIGEGNLRLTVPGVVLNQNLQTTAGVIFESVTTTGDITIGDDLILNTDSSRITMGADDDISFTHLSLIHISEPTRPY